jgi:glycine dehydrogenase subunit 1
LFHEAIVSLPVPAAGVLRALKDRGILGGLNLEEYYPELGSAILLCATETKTHGDLENYAECLNQVLDSFTI